MTREIRTPRENLRPQIAQSDHQNDVIRREQAFDREDAQLPFQPSRILSRPAQTFQKETVNSLRKMELALRDPETPVEANTTRKHFQKEFTARNRRRGPITNHIIDIAMIGAPGFNRLIKRLENTLFTTSLYEIDRIIEEKLVSKEETND